MGYLTAKQFSKIWGISERRIIKLCSENRIDGAEKNGMVWLIPENTNKPADKRNKISKYINTQKKVMIINIDNEIGYNLIPILKKEGYIVEGCSKDEKNIEIKRVGSIKIWQTDFEKELERFIEQTDKYYDGLVVIDIENSKKNRENLIRKFSEKMNYESSIVIVNRLENSNDELEKKLANELNENIGIRINTINIDVLLDNNVIINYNEIAEDVNELLTKFNNTTGMRITTNGGYIKFGVDGRTKGLETGKFYKTINHYFNSLNKESYLWCASMMMEDEWTESPLEMKFRVTNLETANRGVKLDRIFIFSKSKIKEFKNNKTLKIYMQSNINTMFVDYDEILEKEPNLLKIVDNGWDGINKDTLIVDLPAGNKLRGYVSTNEKELKEAYKCFQRLKTYAKNLKDVLK